MIDQERKDWSRAEGWIKSKRIDQEQNDWSI